MLILHPTFGAALTLDEIHDEIIRTKLIKAAGFDRVIGL